MGTRLGRHWLADSTTRHMGLLFAGHGLRLALGVVSSAILARGLGPAGLSLFAVVGAAASIAATVADFGLSTSGIRHMAADLPDDPSGARRTGQVLAWCKMLGALLVAGLLFAGAKPIAALLKIPPDAGPVLVRIAAVGLLATSLGGAVSAILQALRRFWVLVATQTLGIVLTILLLAALWLPRPVSGSLEVAAALAVGIVSTLAVAVTGLVCLPAGWRRAMLARPGRLGGTGRRLLAFSRWLWLSAMLSILIAQLDLLMLNRLLAPSVVGFYALALNLAFKADILNQTLHTVLLPTVAGLRSAAAYRPYLRASLARCLGLALLLAVLAPLARPLVLAVYGPAYAPAIPVLYALLGVVLFDLLTMPFLLLAFPLDMPHLIAAADAVRVVTFVLLGAALIPIWGLYGAVAAKLAAKVAGALLLGGAVVQRLARPRRPAQAPSGDAA